MGVILFSCSAQRENRVSATTTEITGVVRCCSAQHLALLTQQLVSKPRGKESHYPPRDSVSGDRRAQPSIVTPRDGWGRQGWRGDRSNAESKGATASGRPLVPAGRPAAAAGPAAQAALRNSGFPPALERLLGVLFPKPSEVVLIDLQPPERLTTRF